MILDLKVKQTDLANAITIDYLATNPANRHLNVGLKHVGLALIGLAVLRSQEVKDAGGLWFESLPSAGGFYERLGMTRQSQLSADGFAVYIMDSAGSKRLLEEIRRNGILKI